MLPILMYFCYEQYLTFNLVHNNNVVLSEKQRAYMLSAKNALILSLVSMYANVCYWTGCYNMNEQDPLTSLVVLYFTSYLVMDMVIGRNEYKKQMSELSGNIHHLAYIAMNIVSVVTQNTMIYLLYMIEELPTVLLAFGNYDNHYRNDKIFGVTFFIFRIAYHTLLTFAFRHNRLVFACGIIILCVHIHWFINWVIKYQSNQERDVNQRLQQDIGLQIVSLMV